MHDLYIMMLVGGVVGVIFPRWGWVTLVIGALLLLLRGS